MDMPLKVLIVEDSEDDALLIMRELKRGGYCPVYERVDTAEAMHAALDKADWNVIISDYVMPCFNGLEALKLLQKTGTDLPFILVSGTIGEATAVEAMKAGAHDYIMKGNLSRLVEAVKRELKEAKMRAERKSMDTELKKRVKELEDFYDIAIGRELRMKELKDEIESLKKELAAYKNT
jgi:DNA-binding NtrC family response regulator